jgi:hypothetical protein
MLLLITLDDRNFLVGLVEDLVEGGGLLGVDSWGDRSKLMSMLLDAIHHEDCGYMKEAVIGFIQT